MADPKMNKWTPTTDLVTLRRMGKLTEELGELQAVAARVVIQGLDEVDPGTGKVNRQRLLDELADVQAQIGCTLLAFDLDQDYLARRVAEKIRQMREWEAMFAPGVAPTAPKLNNCAGCVHENAIGGPCRTCVDSSNRLPWDDDTPGVTASDGQTFCGEPPVLQRPGEQG